MFYTHQVFDLQATTYHRANVILYTELDNTRYYLFGVDHETQLSAVGPADLTVTSLRLREENSKKKRLALTLPLIRWECLCRQTVSLLFLDELTARISNELLMTLSKLV